MRENSPIFFFFLSTDKIVLEEHQKSLYFDAISKSVGNFIVFFPKINFEVRKENETEEK